MPCLPVFTSWIDALDTLAAQSDMRAAAYQLGRGLAEAYWALVRGAPALR